ncbi:hypothetical protein BDQ12DRAFT_658604 [Crucibulum laeve]|uniref:Nephrocystin 3-like N-terminal domain-containing protein n=1 Tax=Crucibulum laeve TaxID=68775 RepID=A0A5C3LLZ3_9AGAR|nr:hypothetical protein BDQ12DRAFT_658604 [Crucibulum laeve]
MPLFENSAHFSIHGGTFNDLQINDKLNWLWHQSVAHGALYNSKERFDPPKCHPETRLAVLDKIEKWTVDRSASSTIMWLSGPVGAGKSAIAQTVCERSGSADKLAAAFFFSRTTSDRNTDKTLVATIASQLRTSIPEARLHIDKVVENDVSIFSKSIATQFDLLIKNPLSEAASCAHNISTGSRDLVVIDGLDECKDNELQYAMILAIALILKQKTRLRFLIFSRSESRIRDAFNREEVQKITRQLVLDQSFNPEADIERFLKYSLDEIHLEHPLGRSFPGLWSISDVVRMIVQKCSGQFIYAATVIKFIGSRRHHPIERLNAVLRSIPTSTATQWENPFAELDALYIQILQSVSDPRHTLFILGALLFLDHSYCRTSAIGGKNYAFMEDFLSLSEGNIYLSLVDLQSLLYIPDPDSRQAGILFLHTSFSEFLQNSLRSGPYFIDETTAQDSLALGCLKYLTKAEIHTERLSNTTSGMSNCCNWC